MPKRQISQVPVVVRPGAGVDLEAEVARLMAVEAQAASGLMKLVNRLGTGLEGSLARLSGEQRKAIEKAVIGGLELSYRLAANSHGGAAGEPGARNSRHKLAAAATGAAGGFGGLPATVVELPATITVMFRAVQAVARAHGEDMSDADTRLACLKVFGSGGPSKEDDGVETAFVAARLGAVQSLGPVVAMVAPRLAAVLGQKVAAQAVPVVGAVTGATINYAFMDYYEKMAEVHFGLRRLMREGDPDEVIAAWEERRIEASKTV